MSNAGKPPNQSNEASIFFKGVLIWCKRAAGTRSSMKRLLVRPRASVGSIRADFRLSFHSGDCDTPDNAIGYAMHSSRSHDAVICVYDEAGNVIQRHEHARRKKWAG